MISALLHEDGGGDYVATFALDWFHEDCRDLLGRKVRLEEFVFDEAGAA
jgi:hypothetical protein